jgi:hypothetical protein
MSILGRLIPEVISSGITNLNVCETQLGESRLAYQDKRLRVLNQDKKKSRNRCGLRLLKEDLLGLWGIAK